MLKFQSLKSRCWWLISSHLIPILIQFFGGANWGDGVLMRFVPSFAFPLNGDSCFTAGAYNGFTKGVICHVARGEFK